MKHKILLYNLGYCTGINGQWHKYALNFSRFLYTPHTVEKHVLDTLKKTLQEEQPDICALLELDKGSLTSGGRNQLTPLLTSPYTHGDIENKYDPSSILRSLPFFGGKANGFISQKNHPFKKHFLKNGTKKILYEIELSPQFTLFTFHFSLKSNVRKLQFQEIELLTRDKKNVMLCGDFNIFKGLKELNPLLQNTNLKLMNNASTFPSYDPKHPLDLFVGSDNIRVISHKVLPLTISDHSGVIIEIET